MKGDEELLPGRGRDPVGHEGIGGRTYAAGAERRQGLGSYGPVRIGEPRDEQIREALTVSRVAGNGAGADQGRGPGVRDVPVGVGELREQVGHLGRGQRAHLGDGSVDPLAVGERSERGEEPGRGFPTGPDGVVRGLLGGAHAAIVQQGVDEERGN
ncbi:hypothetical protein [Streptomyces sp. NBC_01264]|uniref:hypothetical protein n=1 Tax=Streptomyces sp. NBC_01264 TaxID=2903804 RepID=UPI00224E169B|nr:hypothetical protein [Streptomyces sp. NBC_01264]MCX4775628.1 hypothetical protein [Streptomyces sp. NBC_01264]